MTAKAPVLHIHTPHVPLRQALELGVSLLESAGCALVETDSDAQLFMAAGAAWSVTLHADDAVVASVVYDDPVGRESDNGKAKKITLYLARYGAPSHWEMRMHNGWMHYWFNPVDKVAMVYGVDMDVLRFNRYDGE